MYKIEFNDEMTLEGILESFKNLKEAEMKAYIEIDGIVQIVRLVKPRHIVSIGRIPLPIVDFPYGVVLQFAVPDDQNLLIHVNLCQICIRKRPRRSSE